jgi:hypothetical protein
MDAWLTAVRDAVAAAAGVAPEELELSEEDAATLLDLARIAAHESGVDRVVDPLAMDFCRTAASFRDLYRAGGELLAEGAPRVFAGKCDCNDVLASTGDEHADEERRTAMCGNVTQALRAFCQDPLAVPIVIGVEDDRISRRLQ